MTEIIGLVLRTHERPEVGAIEQQEDDGHHLGEVHHDVGAGPGECCEGGGDAHAQHGDHQQRRVETRQLAREALYAVAQSAEHERSAEHEARVA